MGHMSRDPTRDGGLSHLPRHAQDRPHLPLVLAQRVFSVFENCGSWVDKGPGQTAPKKIFF